MPMTSMAMHLQPRRAGTILFSRLRAAAALEALQAEVDALMDQAWLPHVNQRDYEGGWQVLPLRCQRTHVDAHPILQSFSLHPGGESAGEWEDLPRLQGCTAIRGILDSLECPVRSARLMQLQAGATIKPHRDGGLCWEEGLARLHVPIRTHPDVSFLVEGQAIPMQAGELWYFNADAEHEVHNRSPRHRTHLVIDCDANPWLVDRIRQGAAAHA